MQKWLNHVRVKNVLRALKPWALYLGIFLLLRYTGLMAGVSSLANQALIKTGVMDATPEKVMVQKKFDYNFVLENLDRERTDVNQFKGKTIFLNLWATWCGPCRAEMASIQKLYEKTDREKIVFIMLSLDQPGSQSKVAAFLTNNQYTFPAYFPAERLPALLNVPSIPTTFIISPEGKVVSKEVGAANYDTKDFKAYLESL